MRARNLSALLSAIHYEPGISRTDLVTRLGLSKTTISALVDELAELHLVESAGAGERVGAGRPSALLWPTSQRAVLVINPEVDVITMALVGMGGHILDKVRIAHTGARPVTPKRVVQHATQYVTQASQRTGVDVVAAVLAVPGAVDAQLHTVIEAPSLRWKHVNVDGLLAASTGLPTLTINNARAATVGEWAFGALHGHRNGICIFSGTGGVGGGLLINDTVVTGAGGLAGEIGRMRIDPDASRDDHRSLEQLMRRDAVVAELGFATLTDEQLREQLTAPAGKRELSSVKQQRKVLANAIASLRDLLDPEVIVLGGYLGAMLEASGGALLREINASAMVEQGDGFLFSRSVGLDDMVLLGAAETHWKQVLADPA